MRLRRPGRLRTLAALMGAAAVLAAGCSAPEEVVVVIVTTPGAAQSQVTVPASSEPPAQPTSPTTQSSLSLAKAIRIASSPKFESKDVGPKEPFTVTVFAGTIKDIAVATSDGVPVEGGLDEKKVTWTAKERLEYGTKYVVKGTAVASDGSTKPIAGSISTVNPSSTVRASFQRPIANGETVGVAAPIILTFFEPIQDKAEAQRALKVTTDKGEIVGTWGWLQDEDVQGNGQKYSFAHFRPKDYWPANTNVHVEANLRGVDYGNAWGREDIAADFKIGRSQVVKAEISSKRLIVIRDGSVVENYPVSYGKEAEPGRNTVSGIHVVTEKYPEFKMCNPEFGYCNVAGEVGGPDQQQRRVHPPQRLCREGGPARCGERLARLHQHGRCRRPGVLQVRALRRPGGSDRNRGTHDRGRRHLRLEVLLATTWKKLSR